MVFRRDEATQARFKEAFMEPILHRRLGILPTLPYHFLPVPQSHYRAPKSSRRRLKGRIRSLSGLSRSLQTPTRVRTTSLFKIKRFTSVSPAIMARQLICLSPRLIGNGPRSTLQQPSLDTSSPPRSTRPSIIDHRHLDNSTPYSIRKQQTVDLDAIAAPPLLAPPSPSASAENRAVRLRRRSMANNYALVSGTRSLTKSLSPLFLPPSPCLSRPQFDSTRETDMRRDVQEIFKSTPHHKQVMMFSATLSKEIRPTCKKFMQSVRLVFTFLRSFLPRLSC